MRFYFQNMFSVIFADHLLGAFFPYLSDRRFLKKPYGFKLLEQGKIY
jgi:hypothetical protein